MTSDEIYQAFYCDYNEHKAFLHSHSYTGNPLACTAGLATLEIFENEPILEQNKEKSAYILKALDAFKKFKNIKEIRQQGMVTAIELQGYEASERIGLEIYKYALSQGVLLRPLGNIIYFMPPYIISYEEIDKMIKVAYQGIEKIQL
jgi:adenosylmethionine-8-amino-7-oxononanoate aminotransferase